MPLIGEDRTWIEQEQGKSVDSRAGNRLQAGLEPSRVGAT